MEAGHDGGGGLQEGLPRSGMVFFSIFFFFVKNYECETVLLQIAFEKSMFGGDSRVANLIPRFLAGDYCLEEDPKNRGYYLVMEDISDEFKVRIFSSSKNSYKNS